MSTEKRVEVQRKKHAATESDQDEADDGMTPHTSKKARLQMPLTRPGAIPTSSSPVIPRLALPRFEGSNARVQPGTLGGMKAITEAISDLKAKSSELYNTTTDLSDTVIPELQAQVEDVDERMSDLLAKVDKLAERNRELESTVAAQDEELTRLTTTVEELVQWAGSIQAGNQENGGSKEGSLETGSATAPADVAAQAEAVNRRNNKLNNVVRMSFYGLMGVEERYGKLKGPLMRTYWMQDPTSDDPNDQLFRPNFCISFKSQKKWHVQVANKIRERGSEFSRGLMTEAELKAVLDPEFIARLEVVFKGVKSKYKNQGKEEALALTETIKRRMGRKTRKAKNRASERTKVPAITNVKYNWMFRPEYQSTDESEWEEIVSDNTDEETQVKRKTRQPNRSAPLKSRPPTYRSAEIAAYFREIDQHRAATQRRQDATRKKGAKFSTWVIGEPTAKALPKAKNQNRPRREFLNPEWLTTQDEEDLKLQIFDPEEAGEVVESEVNEQAQGNEQQASEVNEQAEESEAQTGEGEDEIAQDE